MPGQQPSCQSHYSVQIDSCKQLHVPQAFHVPVVFKQLAEVDSMLWWMWDLAPNAHLVSFACQIRSVNLNFISQNYILIGKKCPTTTDSPIPCSGAIDEQYSAAGQTACQTCPAGNSCPTTSSKLICTSGTYSLAGEKVCTTCPAGSKCSSNFQSPVPCDGSTSEQYSLPGKTQCSTCPAGTSCASTSSAPVDCISGYYALTGEKVCTQCPAGSTCATAIASPVACSGTSDQQYSPSGSTTCLPCPAGFSCSTASSAPVACSPGSYAQTSEKVCTECPVGMSCATTTASPVACTSGSYSVGSAIQCTPCPAGSECSSATVSPVACTTGTYSLESAITCTQCPAGSKCPSTSVSPTVCSGATDEQYSPAGSTACLTCPAGFSCQSVSSAPVACNSGWYALVSTKVCTQCPAGSSCATKIDSPVPCTTGTFSNAGATSCSSCSAGFQCSGSVMTACTSGQYSLGGNMQCTECPAGSKCLSNSLSPVVCSGQTAEQYSLASQTACSTCPAGSSCSGVANAPVNCLSGTYSLSGGQTCIQCPAGFKCFTTSVSPIVCSGATDEQYSLAGSTACSTCPAGKSCLTTSAVPVSCTSGYYSLQGGGTCTQCPAGSYCFTTSLSPVVCDGSPLQQYSLAGATACSQCPAGSSCSSSSLAPVSCTSGYYSLLGEKVCTECPAGSKCPTLTASPIACSGVGAEQYSSAGQTACQKCPAGKSCLTTSAAPVSCTSGYYSLLGGGTCIPCPAGSYCSSTSASPVSCSTPTQYSSAQAIICLSCPAGNSCSSPAATPATCGSGYYSQLGVGVCTICPAGSSCATNDALPVACLTGWYQQTLGSLVCLECPAGSKCPTTSAAPIACSSPTTYSLAQSTTCTPCTCGYSCTTSNVAPVACAAGQYAVVGNGICRNCPTGYTCTDPCQSPSGCSPGQYSDANGACVLCQAGYYCQALNPPVACEGTINSQFSYIGQEACQTCPAGYECPNPSQSPLLCQYGYYSAAGDAICTICPAGSSCSQRTVAPVACATGYYSMVGSTYCSVCPLGYQCPTTSHNPVKCPTGTYASTGQTTCTSCEVGYFCPSALASQSYPCAPGFYSSINQVSCTACPAGYSCLNPAVNPIPCTEGQFSFGFSTVCTTCPAGYYCPSTNQQPVACPTGKSSMTGQSECIDCQNGYACLATNDVANQVACSAGQYSVQGAVTTICRDCPVGHYCPNTNQGPIACSPGWTAISTQIICTQCPAGSYCPTLGASALICPLGTYQNNIGQTYCNSCPPGSYCPSLTISAPTYCPTGSYGPVGNLTLCFDCPEGFICPNVATQVPIQCPLGTYSIANSVSCITCEAGSACPDGRKSKRVACATGYFSNTGSTHCLYCPIGVSCSYATVASGIIQVGDLVQVRCPDGQTSDEGASTCIPCPVGSACNSKDSQGIIACSLGFYSLLGDATCHPCPAGFECPTTDGVGITACAAGKFSAAASIACTKCPTGFYCPFQNQAVMERCSPGTYSLGLQQTCLECPEHFQCPHRDQKLPLADGYFSPQGTSVALICRAGWECCQASCTIASLAPFVRPCELGYYSGTGSTQCTICPVNYYCPLQDHQPLACPEGYQNLKTGQVKCTNICPRGWYRNNIGTGQCFSITDGQAFYYPWLKPMKCQSGTFSNNLSVQNQDRMGCQQCDAGVLCQSGETAPSPLSGSSTCPPGYWCNQQDEKNSIFGMWPCPAGFFASGNLLAKNRDEACTQCTQGFYCEGANNLRKNCEPGYYCPTQTTHLTQFPCKAGTYYPTYSAFSSSSCLDCPSGSYCPTGSASPILCLPGNSCPNTGMTDYQQVPCPGGSYQSLAGQTSCTACPQGAYCPTGSAYPLFCPAGTYNDMTSIEFLTDCKACPINFLCSIFGLISSDGTQGQPVKENGYLTPLYSKYGQELPCPPGTIDNVGTLTSPLQCSACDAGFACVAGTSSSGNPVMKQNCAAGYYCPTGTMHDKQFPCSGGTYSASNSLTDASQCTACPAGSFCPPGTYKPFICPNGYYCLQGTENYQHTPCYGGTYSFTRGLSAANQCLQCPIGSFCQQYQVVFPRQCPVGTYVDVVNAVQPDNSVDTVNTVCKICPAGSACPITGSTSQTICPQGTYSPAGSDQCFSCLPGYDCSISTAGLTLTQYRAPSQCTAGYYCNGSIKKVCSVGFYCPKNTLREIPCPVGTYNSLTTQTSSASCLSVTAGSYTSTRGQSSFLLNLCALGYYCPAGSHQSLMQKCAKGTYQDTTGASTCKTCPIGNYCTEASIYPIICPQGFYCPVSTSSPIECPVGTFGAALGLKVVGDCQACTAGAYCSQMGLTSPDGLCDPGYYCSSGAKVPNPTDGTTGNVCPVGGFCQYGSQAKSNCPPGTYNTQTKGKTQQDCVACDAGSYCSGVYSAAGVTGPCAAGYYCPLMSTVNTQMSAQPGTYTLAGASSSTNCPVTTFNPFTAKSSCTACTAGFYCPTEGITNDIIDCPLGSYCLISSSAPIKCPIGTYMNQFNAKALADCKQCLPGFYCNAQGLTTPTAVCDQGYFCNSGSYQQAPAITDSLNRWGPCPEGFYCPSATTSPYPCPSGTYSTADFATTIATCISCTAGNYCSQAGQSAMQGQCAAGYYCPTGSVTSTPEGSYCGPGYYCPAGSSTPTICAGGTYQPMSFQSSCFACPVGYYCPQGATQYKTTPCLAGHFCPGNSALSTDNPCLPGTYQPVTGQESCINCDPGKYCAGSGLVNPSGDCAVTYYCLGGSTTAQPGSVVGGLCTKGNFCPAGSPYPKKCTPGSYCNAVGLGAPVGLCTAGYYCVISATTDKPTTINSDGGSICGPGYYCPAGSSSPLPCPAGTYSSASLKTALADCVQCTAGMYCESSGLAQPTQYCAAGYYCTSGSKTPKQTICPIGNKCQAGSTQPTPCVNQYQDMAGQSICKICPAGFKCSTTAMTLCGVNQYCALGAVTPTPCPIGKFTMLYNASSVSDCVACLPGYYCISDPVLIIKQVQCPAGVICTSGASTSAGNKDCPVGYFCPAGTSNPRPCTPGYYCATTKLGAPTGQCLPGYYCLGFAKVATPADNIQGNACPIGHYCPAGTVSPIGCPIGTYNPSQSSQEQISCLSCPAGYLCNQRGLSNYNSVCPAGYYCPDPRLPNVQQPCTAGHYCPQGSTSPTICGAGTYQPNTYQQSCIVCPIGFYCDGLLSTALVCPVGQYCPVSTVTPSNCPIGTYNPFRGSQSVNQCLPCREGQYCSTLGASTPTGKCAGGYFCKTGANSATPNQGSNAGLCNAGFYCPIGSAIQLKCPVGTFSNTPGISDVAQCTQCTQTTYCSAKGLIGDFASIYCGSGFLCTGGTKSQTPSLKAGEGGALCPVGKFCLKGVQTQCPIGTYQPNLGQSDCKPCPIGKYCNTLGMSEPADCPAGQYCPQSDITVLSFPCPAGTYSPFLGNKVVDDCLKCPQGYFCTQGSITPTGQCTSPSYCALGSSTQTFSTDYKLGSETSGGLCPAGYTCPTGTVAPIPCPLGTYQPLIGQSTCQLCPAGKYCDELGANIDIIQLKNCKAGYFCISGSQSPSPTDGTLGKICAAGFYCPIGTIKMLPCEGGTYEPRQGSSQCQSCPAGFYCVEQSVSPKKCPIGFYCGSNTITPRLCPAGKYGQADGLESENQCAHCPAGQYCTNGVIKGQCSGGYYCNVGGSAFLDDQKLCPVGHYCPIGSLYPTICTLGTTTVTAGNDIQSDCKPCAVGFYCLQYSSVQFVCPKGYYCLVQQLPSACPMWTYNPSSGASTQQQCLSCPPGYFCNSTGIASYQSYPCPQGSYCPLSMSYQPVNCPAGTYNSILAAPTIASCLPCTAGFTCPTGTIYPIPCKNGTYCPQNSTSPATCQPGYYCPTQTGVSISCPKAFYCPSLGSDQYSKCLNGTYCPTQSQTPIKCPSGSFGSSNPMNDQYQNSCTSCDPGQYSLVGDNTCQSCTPGYVCLGNTSTSTPHNQSKDNGYICPIGYYCTVGSQQPKPCPKGAFGASVGLTSIDKCQLCPSGSYGDSIAATSCIKCGGSSRAKPGAQNCLCSGLNRIYLTSTTQCICKPGFVPTDNSNPNSDSLADCQEKIYPRCTNGQQQDQYGNCQDSTNCSKQCDGGNGTIQSGLGVCQCQNAQNTDDVCDDLCRTNSQKTSFNTNGQIKVYDPVLNTTQIISQQVYLDCQFYCVDFPQALWAHQNVRKVITHLVNWSVLVRTLPMGISSVLTLCRLPQHPPAESYKKVKGDSCRHQGLVVQLTIL